MTKQSGTLQEPLTKVNIGRLTNSIFVFTLFLLFTNIRIPAYDDLTDATSPHVFGLMQLPDFLSFLTAFMIIGMIWILAFHTFHMVARVDRTYIYLHFALLLMLMMVPVSCHYAGAFPGKSIFPTLFHGIMLLLGLFLLAEWLHISGTPPVMRSRVAGWQTHCISIKMLFLPVTAITGIILALLDLPFTQYIYYITMAAFFIVSAFAWKNLEKSARSCRIPGANVHVPVCEKTGPFSICNGIVPHDMFEIMINGVFAFVMTFIIKNNIPLPRLSDSDDAAFLMEYLSTGAFNDLVSFVFLFIVFAIFYILFFEMLKTLRTLDRYFVYLSFGFVLSLILMPLTSLLYSLSDLPVPYGIAFHANVLISGLLMIVLWNHASRGGRLLYPETDPVRMDSISLRLLLFPLTAVACLLLDSWGPSFELNLIPILYLLPCLAFFQLSRRC